MTLLEVHQLSKAFGGVRALDGVSLALEAGEVVAVVGENGAGKSTLIKILAGIHRADSGAVRLDGVELQLRGPAESMASGVAVIHQELHLADNLSIAANLFLGREPLLRGWWLPPPSLASRWRRGRRGWRALGWIDRRRMEAQARVVLERVGLDRDPRQAVAELQPAARQLVEIARALSIEARVVVMDEPTSSLGREEADRLLGLVEGLRRSGVGVLYVSHRLEEVVRVADRAVVLRDGRVAGELERAAIDAATLVRLMAGREVGSRQERAPAAPAVEREPTLPGPVVLVARGLRIAPGAPALGFELRAGEILGLFGLVGAGRTALLETLFGLRRPAGGSVLLPSGSGGGDRAPGGRELEPEAPPAPRSAASAIAAGVALVPEDRKTLGLVAEMTVTENLMLADQARRPLYARRRRADERRRAAMLIERLDIRPVAPDTEVKRLSGGNQQKVALGKWLALEPRVLLLDEPTRGVDVGARAEIHQRLRALARSGVAILLSSAETDEVLALADRVIVLRRGEIAGVATGAEREEETLLRLAAGGGPPSATRLARTSFTPDRNATGPH